MPRVLCAILALITFQVLAAEPGSRFLLDHTYVCQKSVKDYGSFDFVIDEETEYILKVGNKREKILYAFEVGGPWFMLQEVVTGHAMVFGVTECFSQDYVNVSFDCIDKIGAYDEGYGYYWHGKNWALGSYPDELPGLSNYNFSLSRGFWRGASTGVMSTATLRGLEYVNEKDSVRRTRWECQILPN